MNESTVLRQFIWILPLLMFASFVGMISMGYSMATHVPPIEPTSPPHLACPE